MMYADKVFRFFSLLFVLLVQIWVINPARASENIDSLKKVLVSVLKDKQLLDDRKRAGIDLLQRKLQLSTPSIESRYKAYLILFNSYKSFIHDSAYVYCKKANECAYLLKDLNKINQSRVNLGFVLVSSGLFKEGLDTLHNVQTKYLNSAQKFDYYFLMARSNFDLSDYNKIEDYSRLYTKEGLRFCETIIQNYPLNSYEYLSGLGLKLLRSKNYQAAILPYERLLRLKTSYQDSAINLSCLSYLYFSVGKRDKALSHLLESSIIDNVHSIKESLALMNLAKYLYAQGEIKEAFAFIHSAIDDNNFYGAKQRKVEISNILPIIERDKINDIENQKKSLIIYASVITFLILLTIYFATTTLRQLRRLRIADKLIINQNNDLNHANCKLLKINKSLDVANQSLTLTNRKLDESNLIKEEYIGYFFNVNADYIDKLDRLKRSLEKIIHFKRYEDLQLIINRLNTIQERESFYASFDEVFLNLFPNFVSEFNALFALKDQIQLGSGKVLNKELRIFALIRLGIEENEMIAKILNYSVNTIYTYKTKVKNRSLVPNDEFRENIMKIRTVTNEVPSLL